MQVPEFSPLEPANSSPSRLEATSGAGILFNLSAKARTVVANKRCVIPSGAARVRGDANGDCVAEGSRLVLCVSSFACVRISLCTIAVSIF